MHQSYKFNTLRPRQNGRHFADDIFKRIFLNENVWISIKLSLKFVSKEVINNNSALVQIMAWRLPGDKPLLNQWWLVYWRIYASLGLNVLTMYVLHFRKHLFSFSIISQRYNDTDNCNPSSGNTTWGIIYPTQSIPLLLMSWRHKKPRYQQ